MQDLSDEERRQVLGEVLLDELKAIREGISDLPTRSEFNELAEKVDRIDARTAVIQAAVTDQSKQLTEHGERLTHLENAA
jgi:hypothetical protein